jgi:putative ABC transport system permease protein
LLVAGEIAIATVLLTVSLAFLRSYQQMLAVDPGFRPDHVLVAGYQLPPQQYTDKTSVANFDREVIRRLASQPTTVAVGLSNQVPDTGGGGRGGFTIEGTSAAEWKLRFAPFIETYGDYFGALGIRLAAGRSFTERDRSDQPLVCIVDQSMAQHEWPGQNPIGKRLHIGNPKRTLPWATVIGVVPDVHLDSPDQPAGEQWYFPLQQPAIIEGFGAAGTLNLSTGWIVLRSTLPPAQMIQTLRSVVAGIDPRLALDPVQPMTEAISAVEAPRRFNTGLITAFALVALLLAGMGIYATIAFSVSQRTQEIAIRLALGAMPGNIVRLILGSGARIAIAGCVVGLLGSLAASRLIESFLFGVSGSDPIIYAVSLVVMLVLALLASAIPALHAAAADPVTDLRSV